MFKAVSKRTGEVYLSCKTKPEIFRFLQTDYPSINYPATWGDKSNRNRNGNGRVNDPIYPEPLLIIEVKRGRPKRG